MTDPTTATLIIIRDAIVELVGLPGGTVRGIAGVNFNFGFTPSGRRPIDSDIAEGYTTGHIVGLNISLFEGILDSLLYDALIKHRKFEININRGDSTFTFRGLQVMITSIAKSNDASSEAPQVLSVEMVTEDFEISGVGP